MVVGAKVTMDNAPWFDHADQFSQQHIRLADIDGSGTNDILYLHQTACGLFQSMRQPLSVPHHLINSPDR